MKIEFCDLKRQYSVLKERIDLNIKRVLEHGKFVNGPEVEELEKKLAGFVGVKNAIGVSSGTSALLVSLIAFGIGKGDYVITTPFTFAATTGAIVATGAKPIFVDINARTYNLDSARLEEFLKNPVDSLTNEKIPLGKIKGIVYVDLCGQVADYDRIRECADEFNLFVLEDAAQAFGAEYNGGKACSLGDVSITSFFPSKPLGGFGDGGMVFTDNDKFAEDVRLIRNHGQDKKYNHKRLGLNFRLNSLQAAILLAKFGVFEREIDERNRIAKLYDWNLQDCEKIVLPYVEEHNKSAYGLYSILTNKRDELREFLENCGIPTAIHYPKPLYLQEAFSNLGYKEGACPISEEIAKKIVSLPMGAYKTEEEIRYICKKIKEFYNYPD
ncbi:MAG: DegT/DnrJ/EryC1/StrS family aminotransferase [Nanoarchaeota archaeon]|nr:DegT/DnrJ/EryC1/StrS family aminotransferase [Nanoarchaeota archaeon]MBU1051158.1 DegT/DnrJ/EryC1/StrS family aminotransferase [Nanoarchaeota archaeon]MBU1988550.1 DegT/DnrJ/EryC1/StrS family aminotransferase [Nanoarchaeota archaeon]